MQTKLASGFVSPLTFSNLSSTKNVLDRFVQRSSRGHQEATRQVRVTSQASISSRRVKIGSNSAMKYNHLGSSDMTVSEVCLGTMTWGMQNTEAEAHQQLDYAISRGINFIDTAEMYPAPPFHPDQVPGTTEKYIGTYLAKNPDLRSQLIIASKVAGYSKSSKIAAHRSDPPKEPYPESRLDAQSIHDACNASLKRLQTDYIDLYQLHWPDRNAIAMGSRAFNNDMQWESVHFRDTLLAIKQLLDAGKIRAYGLSNETSFGVCQFVRYANEIGMPKPVTIQNSFCLLNRAFEYELAETCSPRNCNIGLLPWSVLAGGTLTGKYNGRNLGADGSQPDEAIRDSRFARYNKYQSRFTSPAALEATEKYMQIAKRHNMSATTLALAFCKSRWYIPSTIIGATRLDQLKENIDAFDVDLSQDILDEIDEVHNLNKDCVLTA